MWKVSCNITAPFSSYSASIIAILDQSHLVISSSAGLRFVAFITNVVGGAEIEPNLAGSLEDRWLVEET